MNAIDRFIGYFSPAAAMRRRAARSVLAHYEAAEPSRLRKFHRERGSQNEMVQRGAAAVRAQARHLCRNHDLSRGALRVLVNNVVGPNGIGVEPQPRRNDGTIHTEYAAELLEAYRDWCRFPDVTQRMPWSRLQRALARAWIRDGEVFAQMITGFRPDLDHGTRVPFSLEAFEAELCPIDFNDPNKNILQGIERNQWGKPIAAHLLKTNAAQIGLPTGQDTKRVPWDRLLHLATIDHIGQVRGVSEFASVITRMEDIKDYEESERVAAKISAMLTAYVKRGTPDLYDAQTSATQGSREIAFKPGMIIDDLAVGEEIGLIDSKRPNPNLITFRQGQLRAFAAGIGASNSSVSKDYNGTYSAQRQELVEQWVHYAVLCDEFVGEIVEPVWGQFVSAAHLGGIVRMPADLKAGTQAEAVYTAQAMPWIDPMKEAQASKELVRSGFASETEIIRARGKRPEDVLEQIKAWRKKTDDAGVVLESNAAHTSKSGISQGESPAAEDAGETGPEDQ
jgi:lambda family phage portal protein